MFGCSECSVQMCRSVHSEKSNSSSEYLQFSHLPWFSHVHSRVLVAFQPLHFCNKAKHVCNNILWQDSQTWTFSSSLAKCEGMRVFTVPIPWTSHPLLVLAWPLNFHAGLWPHRMTDRSKVGQSEHQITSLYLHHNIFPWSLLLHILSQYWQMLTRPQRR